PALPAGFLQTAVPISRRVPPFQEIADLDVDLHVRRIHGRPFLQERRLPARYEGVDGTAAEEDDGRIRPRDDLVTQLPDRQLSAQQLEGQETLFPRQHVHQAIQGPGRVPANNADGGRVFDNRRERLAGAPRQFRQFLRPQEIAAILVEYLGPALDLRLVR